MLGNFLYYIIALLIYATYQPPADTGVPPLYVLILFLGLSFFFAGFTWTRFRKIEQMADRTDTPNDVQELDNLFHAALTRHSIVAILVYAIDIYALKLSHFLGHAAIFQAFPTLEALVFLGLFVAYLAVVWACAYNAFLKIYHNHISRRNYVLSNISFSIPVILPWLFLSITADIIHILPFDAPRRFLSSTEGQIAYFMFFLMLIAIIGPVLILKFWGCRPLLPGPFRHRIELLCRKANMHYRDIMVWPLFGGRMITAGVMGLVRRFRYILITPALMRHLTPYEIDAVIAHEIGHIKKHHLFFYLVFFAGYLIVALTTLDLMVYAIVYAEAAYGLANSGNPAYTTLSSIGFSALMIAVFLIYFRYIFGYFMRNFERQADLFAFGMFNDATPLISTFEKITITSNQSPKRPNWHHFSIQERIDTLRKCEKDPSVSDRHNAKVRISIVLYLFMISAVAWMGIQMHSTDMGSILKGSVLKAMVLDQIENSTDDPELYQLLGDIYLNEKKYKKAISAYEEALRLDNSHVRTLNNLAWLLATCDEKQFLNPEKALALAKRAAAISQAPHILDTLAEAHYVNAEYAQALRMGEKALARAETDRPYYRKQIVKFKDALKKGR